MSPILNYLGLALSLIAAIGIGLLIGSVPRRRREGAILRAAQDEAEQAKKELLLEARQQAQELRDEAEERAKRREEDVARAEERVAKREERLGTRAT